MVARNALVAVAAGALSLSGVVGLAASASAAPSPGTEEIRIIQIAPETERQVRLDDAVAGPCPSL